MEVRPIVPVLENLPPPPPEPEPEPQSEAEAEEEAVPPESPKLARRRQLLRILIPDDNETPISDDEEPGGADCADMGACSDVRRMQLQGHDSWLSHLPAVDMPDDGGT